MVNHILTVRGRTASISPRTLVQGTVGQDTLTLDLDSEWNGLNVTVTFVAVTTEVTPALNANVCEVPHEVLVDSGEVDVFVLGTRDGKAMRHASLAHKMVVKKSNMSDGSTTADPSISAYRQAYDDAVKATEAANSAAGAAGPKPQLAKRTQQGTKRKSRQVCYRCRNVRGQINRSVQCGNRSGKGCAPARALYCKRANLPANQERGNKWLTRAQMP